jgi:DNA polymerase sigma
VPKIKKFGSLVTGLALESSDMDMAVTNLILPDREMMIENLENFADCLKSWEMIENLKAISTASIPVIKAIVDLNRLRDKEMNGIETEADSEQK